MKRPVFSKNIQKSNLVNICPVGNEFFREEGQTDGHRDSCHEANRQFSQFWNRV
jgi:hypothetical protein